MKYLAKVPFIRIWTNFFVFKGKETFKEYLVDFILYMVLAIGLIIGEIYYFSLSWYSSNLLLLIDFLTYFVIVLPLLSMTARRFFTVGSLWGFCFFIFIPIGGLIWAAIACLASRSEEEVVGKNHVERVKLPMKTAAIVSPVSVGASLVIFFIVALIIDSIPTVKTNIEDYQFIYEIVDTFKFGERNIIGFGQAKYNSYLLLVPRETPSTLEKFYYRWKANLEIEDYGFYFECKLEKEKFDKYVEGLDNFEIKIGDTTKKLYKTEDIFDYPTYVAQWEIDSRSEARQVLEYIMLDNDQHKVIYAFSMAYGYEEIVKNASYNIVPKHGVLDVQMDMCDYSIYRDKENKRYYKLDEMDYDISFLNYLL